MAGPRHTLIPASYLLLERDGGILLSRRQNTGFADGSYSFVAGHVEMGETFVDALIREAEEEAGIRIRREDISFVHALHRVSTLGEERIDLFFRARRWAGTIVNREPQKCAELSWYRKDALPEGLLPFLRDVVSRIDAGKFYSEDGFVKGRKAY